MIIFKFVRIMVHRLRTQGVRTTLLWLYGRGVPRLTGVPLLRFSRVTPQLFVGSQYGRRGKRVLERAGINGDVNLRIEFDDAAHGLALDEYCHLPTVDETAPSIEHLQEGVVFIRDVLAAGGKVYIHCAGGVGRAPTMAAAYLMAEDGLSLDEALALIAKGRPFVDVLPPQMEQLRRFEATLQGGEAA